MNRISVGLVFLCALILPVIGQDAKPPVKLAIVGLSHDHAFGFFPQLEGRKDVELVGVVEANPELVEIYSKRFKLDAALFHRSLDDLFARSSVQAVAVFTSTFEHRAVVERCAAQRVDVMMEKPLAVNMEHARAIEAAAKQSASRCW
jgi:predicted dehydrogenase